MMRLRRALALVTLYVLASAATGNTEGKWVLWYSFTSARAENASAALEAFDSKEACERRRQQTRTSDDPAVQALKKDSGLSYFVFRCLPDTVDPRGPKGK